MARTSGGFCCHGCIAPRCIREHLDFVTPHSSYCSIRDVEAFFLTFQSRQFSEHFIAAIVRIRVSACTRVYVRGHYGSSDSDRYTSRGMKSVGVRSLTGMRCFCWLLLSSSMPQSKATASSSISKRSSLIVSNASIALQVSHLCVCACVYLSVYPSIKSTWTGTEGPGSLCRKSR